MFCKPYKIKSNNTLKNTDKKALIARLKSEFPQLSDEDSRWLVPARAAASWLRLTVAAGGAVAVLVVDNAPLLVDVGDRLAPTVVALWRLPHLLPAVAVHAPLLPKLQGGTPLYLPGVVVPPQGVGFPLFPRGALLALHTPDNEAAAAVGRALLSSADMLLKVGGVCFEALNVVGDMLCKEPKFTRIERPRLAPVPATAPASATAPAPALQPGSRASAPGLLQYSTTLTRQSREEWPALDARLLAPLPPAAPSLPSLDTLQLQEQEQEAAESEAERRSEGAEGAEGVEGAEGPPGDMDGLLRYCLLRFLKHEAKRCPLPLKTNLLYKNYIIPMCPPDRTVDVRKSSYKKMGKFLDAMQKEGLLEVRELERGVDAVVAVNPSHPAARALPAAPVSPAAAPPAAAPAPLQYRPPRLRELLAVTAPVLQIFEPLKKGATLTPSEARTAVTQYVQRRGLTALQRAERVLLDAPLASVLNRSEAEEVGWEEVISGVQGRMTQCTELRFPDGETRLTRTRLPLVTMATVTRSGNKKVTLVSNLEAYGFNLCELARACQAGAAAACGVTRSPGSKHDQLMLQGDQTYFIAKLLTETFGLPKKYVEGAEKALKKKNK